MYDWLESVLANSSRAVLLSRGELWSCFEMLLDEDEEEWSELDDALDRRLRLARAVLVLSRAMAAIDRRLFFQLGTEVASV